MPCRSVRLPLHSRGEGCEADPACEFGTPDPSRDDEACLSHPLSPKDQEKLVANNVMEYSKKNFDVLVFNFDLDTDRIGIVWGGELYKGDKMFYPIVDYILNVQQVPEGSPKQNEFYVDSRMNMQIAQIIEAFGGVAKLHPKGHSKVKASMDMAFEKIAKERAKSVKDLIKETGFAMHQAEYSLHMFSTNNLEEVNYGVPVDDAIRFMFFWANAFADLKRHYVSKGVKEAKNWTMKDYIKYLKDQKIITDVYQLSEQRTPMDENAKKDVMLRMKKHLTDFFADNPIFENVDWLDYKGQKTKISLVDIDGVFHLKTPLGDFFWGWSNTSPKVAFGAQSIDEAKLKQLTEIMLSVFVHSREEAAKELKLNLEKIDDKETKELFRLFGKDHSVAVEDMVCEKYSDIDCALNKLF
ncbi:hypothetical protein KKC59_00915 [bacterium]|nr:hypothetical protein [bacterium]